MIVNTLFDKSTEGVPYTVTFDNQSVTPLTLICYQSPAPSTMRQLDSQFAVLAWKTLIVPPKAQLPLIWDTGLSFQWSNADGLSVGDKFTSEQNVAGGVQEDNQITLVGKSNGSYELTGLSTASGTGMEIIQSANVDFNKVAVGVAMDGDAIYASMAQPNISTVFESSPSAYFIAYAPVMEQGSVLDVRDLLGVTQLQFPTGSYSATATLLPSMQWQISYLPGSAKVPRGETAECSPEALLTDDEPDRKYTGYRDSNTDGFEGVSAAIGYVAPESVCYQTNTWIGLDYLSSSVNVWLQIGWASEKKPTERLATYVEVERADDSYNIYYHTPLVGGVTYEIDKKDTDAVWTIADAEYHREAWAGIVGDKVLPNAQYTVEVFDSSCDYVPGSAANKNAYGNVQVKKVGSGFSNAPLSTDQTDDPNGNAAADVGSTSTLTVWDTRAGTDSLAQCGTSLMKKLPMMASQSPLRWNATKKANQSLTLKALQESISDYVDSALSSSMGNVEWGQLEDDNHFSANPDSAVGKVSLTRLNISDPKGDIKPRELAVDLYAYAETGVLAVAATQAKADWVAPSDNFLKTHVHDEVARAQITIEELDSQKPYLKLEDVFSILWREKGIAPDSAGQIIIKPKLVSPMFPRVKRRNSYVPKRAKGVYWVVEVLGSDIHHVSSPDGHYKGHLTRLLCLIDDHSGELFYSIGMP